MTKAELVAKLRDLLAGERSAAAAVEAEEILAELEAEKSPRPGQARVTPAGESVTPAEDDEAAKWRRLLTRIGRGGSMSAVVYAPGSAAGRRTEHVNGLVRDSFNPWR